MKKKFQLNNSANNKKYWIMACLITLLMTGIIGYKINRPFIGLHSLGQAHFAWLARTHVNYGLGYTKGLDTLAVGHPPKVKPDRYLDHPQLTTLLNALSMKILGVNVWAVRAGNIMAAIAAVLMFFMILRGLYDTTTAIISGFIFCIFPLVTYFGDYNMWLLPFAFTSIWCYLTITGGFSKEKKVAKYHYVLLAFCLFIGLQLGWEGFFWAFGIGLHYVLTCIVKRNWPNKLLLAVLIISPALSLVIDLAIILGGSDWDFERIIELYKWRASKGEMESFEWGKWFARFWEFAVLNFTMPVLILSILYLTAGQFLVFTRKPERTTPDRKFRYFLLFLLPGILQLFLLKGTLWMHHFWELPLAPLIAITATLAIMIIFDILSKLNINFARLVQVLLIILVSIFCFNGLQHYVSIRHWSPAKVEMFTKLNQMIPGNQSLLSFQGFIFDQNKAKQAAYRPEVAWYLDREVVVATSFAEIQKQAKAGLCPYYLIPMHQQLKPLLDQLTKIYKCQIFQADPGGPRKAPMMPYLLFDLKSNRHKTSTKN